MKEDGAEPDFLHLLTATFSFPFHRKKPQKWFSPTAGTFQSRGRHGDEPAQLKAGQEVGL